MVIGEPLAGPPADTRRVNLYRLLGGENLRDHVSARATDDQHRFRLHDVRVGDMNGLLVEGWSDEEPLEWTSMVRTLTTVELPFTSTVASAALFVDLDGETFAVTFNQGWRLVRESTIDRGFGIDFAVRVVDDDEIRHVTRWALSAKSRVDRNVVPSGQGLWSFGLREHAELVRQLTAMARVDITVNLTHMRKTRYRRNPRLRLECGESLKLPLSVHGDGLISDLREISRVLREHPVSEELGPLRWVRRVSNRDERREELDSTVVTMLAEPTPSLGEVGIAYPAKYFDGPEVHRCKGILNGTAIDTDDLTLNHLASPLRDIPAAARLQALRSGQIDGYDEAGHSTTDGMPAVQWIAAEVVNPSGRYILLDGDWYELGDEYVRHVDRVVHKAFDSPPPWQLPAWSDAPKKADGVVVEGAYNEHVANVDSRFLCLDKKLVKTRAHRKGFEACDLLGPDNSLVHVKKTSTATGSSPLSHLFAQGLVAAESFTDPETWEKFCEVVAQQDPERASRLGARPGSLVFAIHHSDKALTADNLFTFARSTLVSAWTTLTTYGIPVHVAVIP